MKRILMTGILIVLLSLILTACQSSETTSIAEKTQPVEPVTTAITPQKSTHLQDKYRIKDYESFKNRYVFCNSNIDRFSSLLKDEGFEIDKGFAINNLTEKYIQDQYLIIISAEYRLNELPPFITKDLKVQDYYSIDEIDEFLVFQAGKATVLVIEKGLELEQIDYLASSINVDHKSPGIKEVAEEITKNASSDLEKSKAIYHWMCTNVTYESYYSLAVNNKEWIHLTYASKVFQTKRTNCNGFANLYAALNRAIGIKARVVGGWSYDPNDKETMYKEEFRHAWNELLIDNQWISVDTTNGASPPLKNSYKYFNSAAEVFNRDHIREAVLNY